MAERFYSIHPDETVFMNYNAAQQQHQQQQQQQQHQLNHHHTFGGVMGQPGSIGSVGGSYLANGRELDYCPSSGYLAAPGASATASDLNNNRPPSALRYFGNNIGYNNKMPPLSTNMMTKYCSDASYLQPPIMMNPSNGVSAGHHHAPGLPLPQHASCHAVAATATGCHYAQSNGNTSCYTRNRYTPYNHNRACAAAAAAAAAVANSGSTPAVQAAITTAAAINFTYQQQQQFTPIYQAVPSATVAAVAATTKQNPAAAAAVAAYERAVASAVQNTSPELTYANAVASSTLGVTASINTGSLSAANDSRFKAANLSACDSSSDVSATSSGILTSSPYSSGNTGTELNQTITLQITNLDYSMDEVNLRNFLMNQLKPITPVVSLVFESSSYAKVTVPDLYFAKQVVSYLHRKKIGHKRMLVSYTRDSSLTEINTLRCQVAGLLKDVPYYTLPMYKFRELFQSRFKTSISVLDLYRMQDICSITTDNNEEKFITLQPALVSSFESSPLMEGLHHSVPYCTIHFKREQDKGWAEQDIEPLPNVSMTITEIQKIIYPLLKSHTGDIPVASLVHCIEGELSIKITADENGVNLEHLVCCVQGIQIQMNNFGIKILGWLELDKENGSGSCSTTSISQDRGIYSKNSSLSDPLYQISREVVELVKMSPKSTMKFNRFIPAYHNHFGKQCRVADYGYTKLIELFEALSTVVQIMGDGENRQITLTHRTQIRRFTSDLLRILRAHGNKSVLLSELPVIFAQTQNRNFDVTDYGVCDIVDILDGLVNSNIVVVSTVANGKDILISIPKRKQTASELEKTCVFAGEMVELFRNAPQYTILFQKFVRSYHYHFAYQCRLSDYGFLKLADLMDAIQGVVQMELANDEEKKVFLSPKVAQRVFAEQCEELIRSCTGSSKTKIKLDEVLKLHKKKFGYQIQAQTLGVEKILEAIELLPYVETIESDDSTWIICHNDDAIFRTQCYRACKFLLSHEADTKSTGDSSLVANTDHSPESGDKAKPTFILKEFIEQFNSKFNENINENTVKAMKHAIEIIVESDTNLVRITKFMKFLMNIVRLLEQRPSMLLSEIKTSLDCSISTCFEFGFPNIFSVLAAYPDIFSVNLGASQERSEVSLLPTTELRLTAYINHQHLFGSLKLPSLKQKPQRLSRVPLSDYNSRASSHQQQGPPAKTRAIATDSALGNSNSYANNCNNIYYQVTTKSQQQQQQQQQHLQSCPIKLPHSFNSSNSSSGNSSIYSTASHHCSSSTLNSSASNSSGNKENSFNASLFNASFNSSLNNSYGELNTSLSAASQAPPAGYKLWDRRQNNYYQGQPLAAAALPPLVLPPPNAVAGQHMTLVPPPSIPQTTNEQATLYELVSNIPMCPMYDPPKPDTPPADNMPFWIDPIWANSNAAAKANNNNTLNIKLPEFKSFNVLPMLLSPYTISKNENLKKQVFNFENHDRKIA